MSDIFREVDEEVRLERLKKLWEKYSIVVIGAAVVVVLAVGAFRGYQWWRAKQAAEAGTAFYSAAVLSEQGKYQDAEAAFAKVAQEGTPAYRTLGALRAAAELAQRDLKAAVEAFDAVARDRSADPVMQDMAVLRAGYLLADTAPYEELRRRVEPLTAAERPFRHSARALLALGAWRANDVDATKRWFAMILADGETPSSVRSQVELLVIMMNAGSTS